MAEAVGNDKQVPDGMIDRNMNSLKSTDAYTILNMQKNSGNVCPTCRYVGIRRTAF